MHATIPGFILLLVNSHLSNKSAAFCTWKWCDSEFKTNKTMVLFGAKDTALPHMVDFFQRRSARVRGLPWGRETQIATFFLHMAMTIANRVWIKRRRTDEHWVQIQGNISFSFREQALRVSNWKWYLYFLLRITPRLMMTSTSKSKETRTCLWFGSCTKPWIQWICVLSVADWSTKIFEVSAL